MLTPVDINNHVFKGGIGYDKKDVEAFMLELSSDYRDLYSANIELKDKIATLNESLQHYRSIEESMKKAMTLSEKTAEETVIAASDRARKINIEAEMKIEAMMTETQAELQSTKDEIYRLKKQCEIFKNQYIKMIEMQKKIIDGELIDIDLGADYQPSPGLFSVSSYGYGGLGSGTYVGSQDAFRERTNQDPIFDHGTSLNMDPFADAANGGGRFSKQTGGVYTGAKKKVNKHSNSSLNIKKSQHSKSNPHTDNSSNQKTEQYTSNVAYETTSQNNVNLEPNVNQEPMVNTNINVNPSQNVSHVDVSPTNVNMNTDYTAQANMNSQTVSKEDIIAAIKAAHEAEQMKAGTTTQTTETAYNNSIPDTDYNNVSQPETPTYSAYDSSSQSNDNSTTSFSFDFEAGENTTQYSGEVEDKMFESRMLDSEDNYVGSEGFDFIVDDSEESEIPKIFNQSTTPKEDSVSYQDDVLSGDVENHINKSNLISNDDDDSEGFSFI